MPKKIRELKSILRKAGFTYKPAKGSHGKWQHPRLALSIIIAAKDGSDAKRYLETQVQQALETLADLDNPSDDNNSEEPQ
jgi:predicted RNA binding protein YcfA (HicA-like mRNA interferase family)